MGNNTPSCDINSTLPKRYQETISLMPLVPAHSKEQMLLTPVLNPKRTPSKQFADRIMASVSSTRSLKKSIYPDSESSSENNLGSSQSKELTKEISNYSIRNQKLQCPIPKIKKSSNSTNKLILKASKSSPLSVGTVVELNEESRNTHQFNDSAQKMYTSSIPSVMKQIDASKPSEKKLEEQRKAEDELEERRKEEEKLEEQLEAEEKLEERKSEEKLKEQRKSEEKLKEQRKAEKKLEKQRKAEKKREERRKTEEKLEEHRTAEEKLEEQRKAEEKLEEQRIAEEKLEEQRIAEEKLEEQHRAEEKLEEQRKAEEKLEEQRKAEEKLEEQRKAEEKLEEQRRAEKKLEEQCRAEEKLEEQRKAEEKLEEQRKAEDKLEEQRIAGKKLEEERRAEEKLEEQRKAEEKLEDLRRAEEKLEEQRRAEEKLEDRHKAKYKVAERKSEEKLEARLVQDEKFEKDKQLGNIERVHSKEHSTFVINEMDYMESFNIVTTKNEQLIDKNVSSALNAPPSAVSGTCELHFDSLTQNNAKNNPKKRGLSDVNKHLVRNKISCHYRKNVQGSLECISYSNRKKIKYSPEMCMRTPKQSGSAVLPQNMQNITAVENEQNIATGSGLSPLKESSNYTSKNHAYNDDCNDNCSQKLISITSIKRNSQEIIASTVYADEGNCVSVPETQESFITDDVDQILCVQNTSVSSQHNELQAHSIVTFISDSVIDCSNAHATCNSTCDPLLKIGSLTESQHLRNLSSDEDSKSNYESFILKNNEEEQLDSITSEHLKADSHRNIYLHKEAPNTIEPMEPVSGHADDFRDIKAYLCTSRTIEDLDTGVIKTLHSSAAPNIFEMGVLTKLNSVSLNMTTMIDIYEQNLNGESLTEDKIISKSVNLLSQPEMIALEKGSILNDIPYTEAYPRNNELSQNTVVISPINKVAVTVPVEVPFSSLCLPGNEKMVSTKLQLSPPFLTINDNEPLPQGGISACKENMNTTETPCFTTPDKCKLRSRKRHPSKKYSVNALPPHYNIVTRGRKDVKTPTKPIVKLLPKSSGFKKKLFDANLTLLDDSPPPPDVYMNDVSDKNFTVGDIVPLDNSTLGSTHNINEQSSDRSAVKCGEKVQDKVSFTSKRKKATQSSSVKNKKLDVSSTRTRKFFKSNEFNDDSLLSPNECVSYKERSKPNFTRKEHTIIPGFYSYIEKESEDNAQSLPKKGVYSDLDSTGSQLSWLNSSKKKKDMSIFTKKYNYKRSKRSYLQSSEEEYEPKSKSKNKKIKDKYNSHKESRTYKVLDSDSTNGGKLINSSKLKNMTKYSQVESNTGCPKRVLRKKNPNILYATVSSSSEIDEDSLNISSLKKQSEKDDARQRTRRWTDAVSRESACIETMRDCSHSSLEQLIPIEDAAMLETDKIESSNHNEKLCPDSKQLFVSRIASKRKSTDPSYFATMETVPEDYIDLDDSLNKLQYKKKTLITEDENQLVNFLEHILPVHSERVAYHEDADHGSASLCTRHEHSLPLVPNNSPAQMRNSLIPGGDLDISRIIKDKGNKNRTAATPVGGPLQSTLLDDTSPGVRVLYIADKENAASMSFPTSKDDAGSRPIDNLPRNANLKLNSADEPNPIKHQVDGVCTDDSEKCKPNQIPESSQSVSPPFSGKWSLECGQPQKDDRRNLQHTDTTRLNTNQVC